ncbi:NACHT domain-containing protein [Paraburkholderia sp. RL17-373-BIF-A]|uniref:hypothetical protein n=1 Tax=Paraburkholderia sp. RL17-373-BIF-A TaxID=3031629 RepID=UPI0038BDE339
MANHTISSFGPGPNPWAIDEDEAARQAIASLRGYAYQLHASLAAWMRLPADGELHLEVAEDYAEILNSANQNGQILRAVQVKDTKDSGAITLNSPDVLKAINTLFSLQESNPQREIFLTYLTTSTIGKERDNPLSSSASALEVWSASAKGGDATELLEALRTRFTDGELSAFLKRCTVDELRSRLLMRLTFACGQPSWQNIEADGREYLADARNVARAEITAARRAYDVLLSVLLRKTLQPKSRKLDHQAFVDAFREATAIAVPSQQFIDMTDEILRSTDRTAQRSSSTASPALDFASIAAAARTLSDNGRPPTLLALFPDVSSRVRGALDKLSEVDRWVGSDDAPNSQPSSRLRLSDLLRHQELHHLVYAEPGAGKSHSLSRVTANLLAKGNRGASEFVSGLEPDESVPFLLHIAGLKTADEVLQQITALLPDTSLEDMLASPRVCILLDGWSEFATGEYLSQRTKLLRVLAGTRVIVCARHRDPNDTPFRCWTLERLDPMQIRKTVEQSFDRSSILRDEMVDLLRIPLVLSLYLLLGGSMATTGDLMAHFHRHLSKGAPEQFESVLSDAIAILSLSGDRSYNKFISALRKAAATRGVVEPTLVLRQLGTIIQRGSVAVAVHDLYWSWLAGVGYLRESRIDQAVLQLETRESLTLALQSGEFVDASVVTSTATSDASLAATVDSFLGSTSMEPTLSAKLKSMFESSNLSVRYRAALASMHSARATHVGKALNVVNQLASEKIYVRDIVDVLKSDNIFANKAALALWLGGPGTPTFIEAISTVGDERWLPWLEQMFHRGLLEPNLALAAALACGNEIPKWGIEHLPNLLSSEPWLLRFASENGINQELALWLAKNYPQAQDTMFAAWFQANRIFVTCGDDAVYEELLRRFSSMTTRAQEVLGMAVPELGDAWVARFQRLAFAEPGAKHHHRLAETISLEIDDETAREWIERGYYHTGWKVLIARHGQKLLPELTAQLPVSFGGQPYVAALQAIAVLDEVPESFLMELNSRLFNETSQRLGIAPSVGESLIFVAGKVERLGMAWLIGQILRNPNVFGGYRAKLVLKEYMSWKRKTGLSLQLDPTMGQLSFERWYAHIRFVTNWDEHHSPEALRLVPDVAVEAVLGPFTNDDDKAEKILSRLNTLATYNDALFERMMACDRLIRLIPRIFADVVSFFPPTQMLRLAQSGHLESDVLYHFLKTADDMSFEWTHSFLVSRVVQDPRNLNNIRAVANMLRSYPRETLYHLLQQQLSSDDVAESDNLHWLLRETGSARRELLIDEHGRWLH